MTFVRNVLHDLVEKKLWPVAIALVVALVAVPVVLGRGSDSPAAPAATDVAAAPNSLADHRDAARAQVVSLEQQAAGEVDRGGKTQNPFIQHHLPKPVDTVTGAIDSTKSVVAGGDSSSSGSSSSPSSGGAAGGGSSTPVQTGTPVPTPTTGTTTPAAKPKPPADDDSTFHVTIKFGEVGAQKTYRNIPRLTPLPSSTNPFFVFLGLKDNGSTAVFLVDADAVPLGDGTCKPDDDDCQTVELKKGDVEFFDLQSGTAGVVQYQLDLEGIDKGKAATMASAARAHARESKAGREYLRTLMTTEPDILASWDFSPSTGLLVEKAPAAVAGDVAHVPAALAQAAQGMPAPAPAPQP